MARWIIDALGLSTAGLSAAVALLLRRLRICRRHFEEQEQKCCMLLDSMAEAVLILDSPNTVLFYSKNATHLVAPGDGGPTLFTPIREGYDALVERSQSAGS